MDAVQIVVLCVAHAGRTIWTAHLDAPTVMEQRAPTLLLLIVKVMRMIVCQDEIMISVLADISMYVYLYFELPTEL